MCGHYQLGFASFMLTLLRNDFTTLCETVAKKLTSVNHDENENYKCILIPTIYQGVNILLTGPELHQLHTMLEDADVEEKTQSLISLFNIQN
ncbi:MAG TPA: hypothetical protein PK987_01220 [Ferruginibacter sp.]|nr:hypothetical protein [Ferruginibacter sp.]